MSITNAQRIEIRNRLAVLVRLSIEASAAENRRDTAHLELNRLLYDLQYDLHDSEPVAA